MIIAVAGGTGSGKSYLARNLANTYPRKEILIIEQDSYYKDISYLEYNTILFFNKLIKEYLF